jgi:hypothetical protein
MYCAGIPLELSVQNVVDPLAQQIEPHAQLADAGDHAARRVVLCRRHVVDQSPAGFRVGKRNVRERAADIDPDQYIAPSCGL